MKDLIIIGAGPIGLACGIEAKKNNLDYLIVDKGMLVNSIYNYPVNTTFFSTSDKLEIGEIPFISHNVKPTRTEALEYYRRVCDSWNLNLDLYNEVLDGIPNDLPLLYNFSMDGDNIGTVGYNWQYDFAQFYNPTSGAFVSKGVVLPSVEPAVFELKKPTENIRGVVI